MQQQPRSNRRLAQRLICAQRLLSDLHTTPGGLVHSIIQSGTLVGVDGQSVQVEIDLLRRLPCIQLSGYQTTPLEKAVTGFGLPYSKAVLILSKKSHHQSRASRYSQTRPLFDLPIAVGILIAQSNNLFDKEAVDAEFICGEPLAVWYNYVNSRCIVYHLNGKRSRSKKEWSCPSKMPQKQVVSRALTSAHSQP